MADIEEQLWQRVWKYAPILQMVPFLKMSAISNNLAFGTATDKSDIDLFHVAETGRLFIVRSFVTMLLQLRGVRRHGDLVAGRFCLCFFVDKSAMGLGSLAIENDVYLAYWLAKLKPIVLRKGFDQRFLERNRWVESFFGNSNLELSSERILRQNYFYLGVRWNLELVLGGRIGDWLESKLQKWQLARARAKSAGAGNEASLVINEHVLKFHNVDRRRKYRRAWFDNYGNEALTEEKFRTMLVLYKA